MSSSNTITLSNKKVVDFYNKNPHFNPEIHLLFIVEALENTINSTKDQVNASVLSSIYKSITESENERKLLNGMLINLNDNFNSVKDYINKIPNEILSTTSLKINEAKEYYINELRLALNKDDTQIHNVFTQIVQDNTKSLLDKTSSLLHEVLPNNDKFIESQFKLFQQSINLDLVKILNDSRSISIDNKLSEFATQLDMKFTNLLHKCINTTEERLSNKINVINDTNNKMYSNQDKLITSMTEIADKFKNSSYKGNYGENILFNVLTTMYPTAEIIDTSKDGSKCGDLLLKRDDKETILFENKVYTCNVPQDEVNKFQRDVHLHEYNGIFLSQSSGILGKHNFSIEINSKNNILLYIHKVNYSQDIIKLGIDVIDTISEYIHKKEISEDEKVSIDYNVLDTINREVSSFINKKKELVDLIKESQKSVLHKLEEMNISSTLVSILNQHFGSISQKREYRCITCNKFSGKSAASLSAHRRHCKPITSGNQTPNEETNTIDNESISISINDPVVNTVEVNEDPINKQIESRTNTETISINTIDTSSDKKKARKEKKTKNI